MTRAGYWRGLPSAAVFGLVGAAACTPAPKAHHQVEIEGLMFRPVALMVAPGDTVTWTNRDVVPHTVTGKSGGWESGEIPAGGSFTHVVGRSGKSAYYCRYHPTMTATLRQP